MEEKIFEGLKYLIYYPKGFQEDKKYPLILFLHGVGNCGETTERLRKNVNIANLRERQDARGYIILAPLCQSGDWFAWMKPLLHLVGEIRELPYIDETRLHVTGNSMGGYGTWEFSTLRPNWVASAMPLCGGGIGGAAKCLVDVPIRAFHGLCDVTVDPIESLQMVKSVNMKGGHAELILFPTLGHNCWETVYSDERNYDWLLSFTTKREKTLVEELSGDYYG